MQPSLRGKSVPPAKLAAWIANSALLDRDTLYVLRSLLARYPYYQTARLLFLYNLYLLHAPSFDEELRKAAVFITDRHVLFNLIEGYRYAHATSNRKEAATKTSAAAANSFALVETFLEKLPNERPKRSAVPIDPASNYAEWLLQREEADEPSETETPRPMKGEALINNFISQPLKRPVLSETLEYTPQLPAAEPVYLSETLAKVHILQGKYEQALAIIYGLHAANPKKNAYFADQIRFLEKLIINQNYKRD